MHGQSTKSLSSDVDTHQIGPSEGRLSSFSDIGDHFFHHFVAHDFDWHMLAHQFAYDRAGGIEVAEMRRDKAFYVRLYCDLAQISGTGMRPRADARFGPEFDCGGGKRTLVD